jgi:zinc transporter
MTEGLILAYLLDGLGGGRLLHFDEVKSWQPEDGVLWAHFDYSHPASREWIIKRSGLLEVCSSALVKEETRPRVVNAGNGLLLALRGINLNPSADPEDMVSIRIYLDANRIITSRNRSLTTTDDIAAAIDSGNGPLDSADFLCLMTAGLTLGIETTVDQLEVRADELEEHMLSQSDRVVRSGLASIRRESIILRRYLTPQREAMNSLLSQRVSWLTEHYRIELRETADHLTRLIENLDATKDRATVIHEELVSVMSEQLNKRMYVLSIVSVIFMPLGFLTGLLGVNVAGIPGAQNPMAFEWFALSLIVIVVVQLGLFKRFKWM